jgi:hypothetical protein
MSERPNLIESAVKFAGAVLDHAIDGLREASPEAIARREASCWMCPDHKGVNDSCNACSCGTYPGLVALGLDLARKRRWASSRCPLNPPRWEADRTK